MYDLEHFTLRNMTECGAALRNLATGASSMESVATRIVGHLFDHLVCRKTGEKSSVLVRFFRSQPYSELTPHLRQQASAILGAPPASAEMKCLTLLGTAGVRSEWNDRRSSTGHQAIPMATPEAVEGIPMIFQLMRQFGIDIAEFLQPEPDRLLELVDRQFSVFHVPDAQGSPHIPAQDEFVVPMSVRSVLGFGGLTPTGELFSIIVFSRARIPAEVASMFKTIALSARLAILPYDGERIFEEAVPAVGVGTTS